MITINENRYYCSRWWNFLLLLLLLWSLSSQQNNDSIIVVSAFDITSVVTSPPPPVHTTTFHRHSYHPQQQQQYHLRYLQLSSSHNDQHGELDNDDDTIHSKDSIQVVDNNCSRQPHQQNHHQYDRLSRRHWLIRSTLLLSSATIVTTGSLSFSNAMTANAATTSMTDGTTTSTTTSTTSSVYIPAIRPTVYRIDTTIPPTLLPVPKLSDQTKILKDLGHGLGTDKKEVFIDRINLNNMLQKAVYGTIDAVKSITSSTSSSSQNGQQKAPASFVCLGLPMQVSNRDIDLTVSLLRGIFEKRLNLPSSSQQRTTSSAIGLAILPCTAQNTIDDLIANRITLSDISSRTTGDDSNDDIQSLLPLYRPILEYAIENHIPIIAMGISKEDEVSVRKGGIQNVNPTSRENYVKDPNGFIAMTNDPKFQLYTDRSLLKDRLLVTASTKDIPLTESISEGNYYAERILRHEAGATFVSQYAIDHHHATTTINNNNNDCCLIAIVAPINDVRYLGGINGRIPRIYQYLSNNKNNYDANESSTTTTTDPNESSLLVSMNDITTILINPTAIDTLSRTVRLRLEIGTGPDTIPYQTKIADYLWFSSSPSVNLLPRVMDY